MSYSYRKVGAADNSSDLKALLNVLRILEFI